MKPIFPAIATAMLLATPALAGGPVVVADDPEPVAPPPVAHDWTGGYAGLAIAQPDAEFYFSTDLAIREMESQVSPSLFLGYQFQRGSWVFGGELAYTKSNIETVGFPEGLHDIIDLKGRIGFASGKMHVYGVVGYSATSYYTLANSDGQDIDGTAFGLGAEFAVSERLTVGLEYLTRELEGETDFPGQFRTLNTESLSLRASFAF